MSNEHTQGILSTDEADHDAPYQDIRLMAGDQKQAVCTVWIDDAPVHDYNAEQRANARRLVACWNACEGIETDVLDGAAAPGLIKRMVSDEMRRVTAQRDHFQALAKDNGQVIIKTACELGEVKAQRDALLEALGKIIEMNVQYCIDRYGDASQAESMSCVVTARSAIAKATGAQS